MSNVQLENGYTKIANELMEVLMKFKPLNGTDLRLALAIIRYTYGFNNKYHELSLSYLAQAINLDTVIACKHLKKLIKLNVVKVYQEAIGTKPRQIGINKNYEEWEGCQNLLLSKSTIVKIDNSKNLQGGVVKIDNTKHCKNLQPINKDINKDKQINNIYADFEIKKPNINYKQNSEEFWKAYPPERRASRKTLYKWYSSHKITDDKHKLIMKGLEIYKTKLMAKDKSYIYSQNTMRWLRDASWEDIEVLEEQEKQEPKIKTGLELYDFFPD